MPRLKPRPIKIIRASVRVFCFRKKFLHHDLSDYARRDCLPSVPQAEQQENNKEDKRKPIQFRFCERVDAKRPVTRVGQKVAFANRTDEGIRAGENDGAGD